MSDIPSPFEVGDSESIQQVYRSLRDKFRAAGVDTADLDARILTCAALHISFEDFVADPAKSVDRHDIVRLDLLGARRLNGEPVARILGVQEFWSHDFSLNEATLIPRPETELLVEESVAHIRNAGIISPKVVDLGTGSGCVLIAILKEIPQATGIGVDISGRALAAARANARTNGVENRIRFVQGSWLEALEGQFDIVVSNPPYIPSADIQSLAVEVACYDPRTALDGGPDGLDAYRAIAAGAGSVLSREGLMLLEIGAGQAETISDVFRQAGFVAGPAGLHLHDLAGIERVMTFSWA